MRSSRHIRTTLPAALTQPVQRVPPVRQVSSPCTAILINAHCRHLNSYHHRSLLSTRNAARLVRGSSCSHGDTRGLHTTSELSRVLTWDYVGTVHRCVLMQAAGTKRTTTVSSECQGTPVRRRSRERTTRLVGAGIHDRAHSCMSWRRHMHVGIECIAARAYHGVTCD